jgi:YWFCY protein/TraM recognition site of TraD and TraG
MNRDKNEAVTEIFLVASTAVLLIHFYGMCYPAFANWGLRSHLSNAVMERIFRTRLYNIVLWGKEMALVGIVPVLMTGKRDRISGYKGPLITLAVGGLLYFGSGLLSPQNDEAGTVALLYILSTSVGYLLIMAGAVRLVRALRNPFRDKPTGGFLQEEKPIVTKYSLNFRGQYVFNGRRRKSYISIVNPRRGVLVLGSTGSGKSWFFIEPAIAQLIRKGVSLFIFDFKFPVLTNHAYSHFLQHQDKYPPATRFYCINFTDLSRSHRCNLIDPGTLVYFSDAMGISRTLLLSMNKTWIVRQGDFFIESPVNFLAALIWFLRKYKDGIYCTLPHVIELSNTPYDQLFTILNAEPSVRGVVSRFIQSYLNNSMEMVDGQIASTSMPLARLISADFYYVLSGNDCSLEINNPAAPAILCLGGDPPRQEALAPVMSLYIDRLNKRINAPGRHACAMVLDEFATVRATSVLTTVTTGRSNDIIPIICVQDINQLRTNYTREEADQFMNITGNLVCGQATGDTARWVSERFHQVVQYKTTVSVNSSDTSVSKSEQSADAVSTATLASLSSGEFVGIVADDPTTPVKLKGFHSRFVKDTADTAVPAAELPVVRAVDQALLQANFDRIIREVSDLVAEETKRIMNDPALRQWVVKRR